MKTVKDTKMKDKIRKHQFRNSSLPVIKQVFENLIVKAQMQIRLLWHSIQITTQIIHGLNVHKYLFSLDTRLKY